MIWEPLLRRNSRRWLLFAFADESFFEANLSGCQFSNMKSKQGKETKMKVNEEEYMTVHKRTEVAESAKRLRRQYLRYKEAEIVYSIQHAKLIELADKAGAIYRIDGYVLINRDIFDEYLERFHQPAGTYSIANRRKDLDEED